MPFGEVVIGAPGAGKSTYAHGKHQLFTALERPVAIVNLDPANDDLPYPCEISIASLITLRDAMNEFGLGPNGGMLYCLEYLERNVDWLFKQLGGLSPDTYVVFDLPGQVEVSTNHPSLKNIVRELVKSGYRLAAVHLCDAHYVTDVAKYVSVLLLSLRAMLQLELPHINVLSKIDLLSQFGNLDFNLDFYTEVQDLKYLENSLNTVSSRYASLNMAICQLIEDFSLVGFETLAVEDRESMLHLMHVVDRATGCIFAPLANMGAPPNAVDTSGLPADRRPNVYSLFSTAIGPLSGPRSDVRDVQERWLDAKEDYDAYERAKWREEGAAVADAASRARAAQPNQKSEIVIGEGTWAPVDNRGLV